MGTISTSGAYTIAKLGIYAAQKAMEVTGNNITNINTEGYTRQRLEQRSMYMGGADRYSSKWEARVGGGVITTSVSQLRDPYLDIRYRTEMSSAAAYETKLKGLNQLAEVLDEVGKGEDDEGVFEAQFNDLIAQLTDMAASGAGKDEYDTLVRTSAKSLVSLFNTYANKLETIRNNTLKSFEQDVNTVNSILQKIQTLNDSIRKSDIHGGPGLELRDERNLLLDQLSEYVKINVRYESESVGSGLQVEKLIVELDSSDITDQNHNGVQLINGQYVTQFSIATKPGTDPAEYVDNLDMIMGPLTDPNGKKMRVKDLDKDGNIQTDPVLDENGQQVMVPKYDADGNAIPGQTEPLMRIRYKDSEEVELTDTDLHGRLQANRELLTEVGEFATQDTVDNVDANAQTKRGIPYYQKALDLMAQKFAGSWNETNTLPDTFLYKVQTNTDGEPIDAAGNVLVADPINNRYYLKDDPKTEGTPVFVDKDNKPLADQTDKTQYVDNPLYSHYKGGVLFSNNGNGNDTTNITAANISISQGWATGAHKILQTKQPIDPDHPQSTLQDNIQHLLSITADNNFEYKPSDLDPNLSKTTFFTGSYQGFLTKMCSQLAEDTRISNGRLENYVTAVNDLYGDRDSVSGVDLNDEAINMMQYNKAYSASCRLLTTLDEMIDKLINGTAV